MKQKRNNGKDEIDKLLLTNPKKRLLNTSHDIAVKETKGLILKIEGHLKRIDKIYVEPNAFYSNFQPLSVIVNAVKSKTDRITEFNTSFSALEKLKNTLQDLERVLETVNEQVKDEQYSVLSNSIESLKDRLFEQAIMISSALFSDLDDNRLFASDTRIHAQELQQILESHIVDSNEIILHLKNQLRDTTNNFEVVSRDTLNNQNQILNEQLEINIKNAEEHLSKLQALTENGQQLAHYLSGQALSGFFDARAVAEQKSVKYWTWGTWFFAVASIAVGILGVWLQYNNIIQNKDLNLQFLGAKFILAVTLGLVAKWTSKRATRHLAEESKYRRLAINMHTIDPYIEKLDPESKNEIFKAVALKIFTETGGNETAVDYETPSGLDLLKTLLTKPDK